MVRRLSWSGALVASVCLVALLSAPPARRNAGSHEVPLLPRVEVVRVLAAPVLHLMVDYYWIRTSHALGAAMTGDEYRDVYLYADLLTDLDPQFHQVYGFAGAALPFNAGGGRWVNTQESSAILEKGLRVFPQKPFLRILLAYNRATFDKDYKRAAQLVEEEAKLPGAPEYLLPLATRLYARAGEIDVGLELAMSLAEDADDPETRETFTKRVLELQLEKELAAVDRAVEEYKSREGKPPGELRALVRSGLLNAIPRDPFGGEIYLDDQGRARSTSEPRRVTELGTELNP